MKERGISFNTEMVRAILAGSKTQTRRVIKKQPKQVKDIGRLGKVLNCKYGEIGDRLWVREWYGFTTYDKSDMVKTDVVYLSDDEFESHELDSGEWIEPRFMSSCCARILLEITGVRVERLQDISNNDCVAEGIERDDLGWRDYSTKNLGEQICAMPSWSYRSLWESIYGAGSWAKNEWVWVIEFKRIEV
jgi:hypothetical protein